jgi:hypothetical protein
MAPSMRRVILTAAPICVTAVCLVGEFQKHCNLKYHLAVGPLNATNHSVQ